MAGPGGGGRCRGRTAAPRTVGRCRSAIIQEKLLFFLFSIKLVVFKSVLSKQYSIRRRSVGNTGDDGVFAVARMELKESYGKYEPVRDYFSLRILIHHRRQRSLRSLGFRPADDGQDGMNSSMRGCDTFTVVSFHRFQKRTVRLMTAMFRLFAFIHDENDCVPFLSMDAVRRLGLAITRVKADECSRFAPVKRTLMAVDVGIADKARAVVNDGSQELGARC
jgi:hypothetical protein